MRLFNRHTTTEQQEVLAAYNLTEQEAEQETQYIPSHCGWCEPYTEGATTGICAACEAKYFPRRHGGKR